MNAALIAAHAANYTAGRQKNIDRIVIHYTAGVGDTARNNGIFFQGANRQASAHYFVDENAVVCSVREGDTAWHAGNWEMNCRSIGIEMCSKKDAEGNYCIPKETVDRAVELTRELMAKYDIPAAGVLRHYDVNGKHCPEPFVRNGALWEDFKRRIAVTDEAASARRTVQEKAGLSDATMDYLAAYQWGEDLLKKLAKAMK